MSSEIEVPETPNWLQELEAKRERRLKARLGHEAGAGAPCLKCGEKCPGLDLHFWRKCCKICKCSKEEHEVPDDDIYGWAQFQLLGSKPNKIKRKIQLPGKKDELELDWTPKGHNDTVDKYLKTLPPEQLPVKGSQAAQDRKQLLQKQIPLHDIDPTLCHELSNDELKQMNDYIAHVKQSSVGMGQIVSLSNIIKANLHMLNPSEAALIASRYPKGIPLSEIVKLQAQNRANALKSHGLSEKLDNLNLQEALPNFKPNAVNTTEENVNPWVANNVRDINYTGYTKDMNRVPINAQFSAGLKPGQNRSYAASGHPDETVSMSLDEKFKQNPNFDPKNIPSQFLQQSGNFGQPYPYRIGQENVPFDKNQERNAPEQASSAFAPYKPSTYAPGEKYIGDSPSKSASYASNLPKTPGGYRPGEAPPQKRTEMGYVEDAEPLHPNFAKNLAKYPSGIKKGESGEDDSVGYENVAGMNKNRPGLPNYAPGKYNVISENQSPTKIPQSMKDLAFSTYDPNNPNSNVMIEENAFAPPNLSYENYPPGYFDSQTSPYKQHGIPTGRYPDYVAPLDKNAPYDQNSIGQNPGQYYDPSNLLKTVPDDVYNKNNEFPGHNNPSQGANVPFDYKNAPYDQNSGGLRPGQYAGPNNATNLSPGGNIPPQGGADYKTMPYNQNSGGLRPGQYAGPNNGPGFGAGGNIPSQGGADYKNTPYDQNSSGLGPGQYAGPNNVPGFGTDDQNVPYEQSYSGNNVPTQGSNVPYDQKSSDTKPGQYAGPNNAASFTPGGNIPPQGGAHYKNTPYDQNSSGLRPGQYGGPNNVPGFGTDDQNAPYQQSYSGNNVPTQGTNIPYDQKSSGTKPGQYAGPNNSPSKGQRHYDPANVVGNQSNNAKSLKKLSELHPGNITIDEDYLQPSQVTIGAIQDINYPEIKAATQGTNDFYEDYSPDSLREILNNVKLPDCHYCKKPFEENEFAVAIDRANVLFHAQCFKCAGCNQILAENIYFYNKETDNVYCGRDYAKVRGFPRCKACDELIFTKEYCLAENSTFHLKHFCCIECDTPLAGQDYTLEDEMPYCLPCFEHSKASKCSSCGKVIKPDEVGCSLNTVHFHAVDECFACKMCKKPLMGKKLLLRNEKLYCSHDCFGSDKK